MEYRIEWIDRETVACRSNGQVVLVWVDFEPEFLARGRVIHTDSISHWLDAESSVVRPVTETERGVIISAIQHHHAQEGRPCRLEA